MINTYLDAIVLKCLEKLNGERSISGVFHLLQGKKSSQTIQDSFLFGLQAFFGIYPAITRDQIENSVKHFQKSGFIDNLSNNKYAISTKGQNCLEDYLSNFPIPEHISGWDFQNTGESFWKRLSLITQTLSQLVHNQTVFYPIQRDSQIQKWVKDYMLKSGYRSKLAESLYNELVVLLEKRPDIEREIFVLKLSGYSRIGLTYEQISQLTKLDETYVYFLFLNTIHFMIKEIVKSPLRYPFMSPIINEFIGNKLNPITNSTQITYQYVLQGLDKEEIAKKRNLKLGTIEDHLVELALSQPDFEISSYVNKDLEKEISDIIRKYKTKQLKAIKEKLADGSYFQIRLVLARYGEK